ncbi:MAG TPA: DNA gyrase inhibitor YacG [Vicinamibacterales bacterium]|nr:DNA gyrase inhibitor YacG [Vicinamibacterales bacterium]
MPVPLCVYCRERPQDPRWRPFCSERCKLFDLAAWADGKYRIPGPPVEERRDDDDDDDEKE